MTSDYAEAVSSWLAKARSDLATARLLIQGNEPHLDTGSYHCQQAAEKALKGWLTSRQVEFRKTHDLLDLLNSCVEIHHPFEPLRESANLLVPLATQFRYPGDLFEPPMDEAIIALSHSAKIVDFVIADLKATHPQAFLGL